MIRETHNIFIRDSCPKINILTCGTALLSLYPIAILTFFFKLRTLEKL